MRVVKTVPRIGPGDQTALSTVEQRIAGGCLSKNEPTGDTLGRGTFRPPHQ